MDRASPLPPRINKKKGWENDQILSEIETQNRTRDQEKVPRQLFLRNLSSSLRLRVVQFFFIYLAVILFLYSRDENNGTGGVAGLEGTYPLQILAFAGAVLSISVASTCLVSVYYLFSLSVLFDIMVSVSPSSLLSFISAGLCTILHTGSGLDRPL